MFCFSGNKIILVSKIRHNHSHLVACSWMCTDKQCVLANYRVEFWNDCQICEFHFLQNGMTTKNISKDKHIHKYINRRFFLISEKEMMTKEKSHYKFFVAGYFCCWSEVLFSEKHMKNYLHPWQSLS